MVLLILLTFLICPQVKANEESEAIRKAGEAFYIQSGLDKVVKELDRKYTPEYVKQYGGWLIVAHKAVVEKQIGWKWTW